MYMCARTVFEYLYVYVYIYTYIHMCVFIGMTTTTTPGHPATYFRVGKSTPFSTSADYDHHLTSLDICTVPILSVWTCWKLSFLSCQTQLPVISIVKAPIQIVRVCNQVSLSITSYITQIVHFDVWNLTLFCQAHHVCKQFSRAVPGIWPPGTWLRRCESARFKRT